jgi:hypothetical protein
MCRGWERPQCSALVASADASLVAPTSASTQTNYGQGWDQVRSRVGTGSGPNEYLTSSVLVPEQDMNQYQS